jgi:hypothetical protein
VGIQRDRKIWIQPGGKWDPPLWGFALKGAEAQAGTLKTLFEGKRPNRKYDPMRKQGASILGIGVDNSNHGVGTFYEGSMTTGYSTDATDTPVQANIVAAGYGR